MIDLAEFGFTHNLSRRVHLPTPGCKGLLETLHLKAVRVLPTLPVWGRHPPCEAAVHATRSFIAPKQGEKVLLKLDVKNAFNSIRRDTVLQAAQTHLPEIYPFIWDCYSSKTSLFHGDFHLDSATGVQQGYPLGPALFTLAIHRVTSEVKSDLNAWYLDDGCIGGDPDCAQ